MSRKARWDKYSIKAEIHRRGETLRSLDEKNGFEPNTCSVALDRPFPKADQAIAAFLGQTLHTLWPCRYDETGVRIRYIRRPAKQPRTPAQRNRLAQVSRRKAMQVREAV